MPIRLVSPHPPPLRPYRCPLRWPRGHGVPLFAQSGTIAIQSKAGRIAMAPHDRPEYQTRPPRSHTLGNTPNRNMYAPPRQLGRLRAPLGRLRAPSKMASCSSRATFRCLRPGGRPGFPGRGLCIAHRQGNGVTSLVFKFWLQSSKGWWRYRESGTGSSFPGSMRETVTHLLTREAHTFFAHKAGYGSEAVRDERRERFVGG